MLVEAEAVSRRIILAESGGKDRRIAEKAERMPVVRGGRAENY